MTDKIELTPHERFVKDRFLYKLQMVLWDLSSTAELDGSFEGITLSFSDGTGQHLIPLNPIITTERPKRPLSF